MKNKLIELINTKQSVNIELAVQLAQSIKLDRDELVDMLMEGIDESDSFRFVFINYSIEYHENMYEHPGYINMDESLRIYNSNQLPIELWASSEEEFEIILKEAKQYVINDYLNNYKYGIIR